MCRLRERVCCFADCIDGGGLWVVAEVSIYISIALLKCSSHGSSFIINHPSVWFGLRLLSAAMTKVAECKRILSPGPL